jgi:glutamyl/glutaminyl-tRNA synthetase
MDSLQFWKIPNDLNKILESYKGEIITRFPPENSGYLHIGHVKALMINHVIAKKFNGKLILRFDDTNPVNETLEYENAIREDIKTLGITPDLVSYSSDFFPALIDCALQLLVNGKAYVDDAGKDIIKQQRRCTPDMVIESVNRNNTIEKNLQMFDSMKNGTLKNVCVRIKFNMKHTIPNCRDPVIFRSIDIPHHRTGNTYSIYPTYDFACPIIDSLENVTHAFRSVEYSDRAEQYKLMLSALELRIPQLFCYGKVKFINTILSKRKIKALIENGGVDGWDDPRLFTLRGLLNRGIHINTLHQFVATLGFSPKTPESMNPEKLFTLNKKMIDIIATRFVCLPKDRYIEIGVKGIIDREKNIPRYIKNEKLGMRKLYIDDKILIMNDEYLKEGEEISLISWGNAFVSDGMLELNYNGNFKSTSKKLLWIKGENSVKVIVEYCEGYNKTIKEYVGGDELLNIKIGDYVQFMKMGYYMCRGIDLENMVVSFIELN